MVCKKVDDLMLKVIDETLTDNERLFIENHIENCPCCREKYIIYSQIGNISDKVNKDNDLKENDNISVPKDFETQIMSKISGIEFKTDKLFCFILGIVSVFFALARLLFFNCEFINTAANKNIVLKIIIDICNYIGDIIYSIFKFIEEIFLYIISISFEYSLLFKHFSLFAFTLLIGIGIIISVMNRGGNRA